MKKISLFIIITICFAACNNQKRGPLISEDPESIVSVKNIDTCKNELSILQNGNILNKNWKNSFVPENFPYVLLLENKYRNLESSSAMYTYVFYAFDLNYFGNHLFDSLGYFMINERYLKKIRDLSEKDKSRNLIYYQAHVMDSLYRSGFFVRHNLLPCDSSCAILAFNSIKNNAIQHMYVGHIENLAFAYYTWFGTPASLKKGEEWYVKLTSAQHEPVTYDNDTTHRLIVLNDVESDCFLENSRFRSLIRKIQNNDVPAYLQLKKAVSQSNTDYEILFFSMIMADRYNYKPACFDVYLYLWKTYNFRQKREMWDTSQFDETTREYALYHLKKAAIFGDKRAIGIWNKITKKIH